MRRCAEQPVLGSTRCFGFAFGRAARDFGGPSVARPTSLFPLHLAFFLRSAQRFFIASDNRLLPSGVRPPRSRFFVVLPLGLPMCFLPPSEKADPKSAAMACPSRSRSFFKSETIFARSKVRVLLLLVSIRERDLA